MERTRKKVIAIFKMHGLKVTANTNLFQSDFSDATFDLNSGKFCHTPNAMTRPFTSTLDQNHPLSIVRHTPCTQRLHQTARNHEQEKETSPGSIPHIT